MTTDDRLMLDEGATFMGATLRERNAQALLQEMKHVPLCAVCPAAQWYLTEDDRGGQELECFCTQFRGVMYDRRHKAVTQCDARADALAAK